MDFGGGDEIRFERIGFAGVVTLTRPQALNALTHRMIKALSKALVGVGSRRRRRSGRIKAEGRAFCAGGDMMQVYEAVRGQAADRVLRRRVPAERGRSRAIQNPMSR